jgi:hypothetical protein
MFEFPEAPEPDPTSGVVVEVVVVFRDATASEVVVIAIISDEKVPSDVFANP